MRGRNPSKTKTQNQKETYKMTNATFTKWLNTFVDEKGIDREEVLTVSGPSGDNYIPVQCLLNVIEIAPAHEQAQIKNTIVKIDFCNGDVLHFFRHLCQAIAN
jgi:hypothetical protein